MLKEICGIELCGANFENLTRLDIFNPMDGGTQKTIKGTLLYGRNGSGKSTIARGFRKIIGEKDSYCFQKLTAEYKSDLIQSIERVLSNAVKEHQQSLRDMMHEEMTIDLSPFAALKGYERCVDLVRRINSAVRSNNDLLQRKIDNPYEIPESDLMEIQPLMKQLREALADLEKERLEYNRFVYTGDNRIRDNLFSC